MEEEKTYIKGGGGISNKKFVVSDIQQMKWEMRFGGSPPHSDEQGFRATCTWKRVGREGSVALGYRRGEIQPPLSTLLINLPKGIREERLVQTHRKRSREGGKISLSDWNFAKTRAFFPGFWNNNNNTKYLITQNGLTLHTLSWLLAP